MGSSKIIDLGMHPHADTFIGQDQYNLSEPVYPLQCILNEDTSEIRVGVNTKPDERYNLYSYSYTSANSDFAKNHWIKYAKEVSRKINSIEFLNGRWYGPTQTKLVEIGSNDGFLASQFKELGHDVLGVDPSHHMAKLAAARGVETCCKYFTYDTSRDLVETFGRTDLIIANNVFNHSNDVEDFVKGVVHLLKDDGVFVYELPYWYCTIKDKTFDQIYHEHVNYFTVKFSYELLKKAGFEIIDAEVVDYHGGSLRVYAKRVDEVILRNHVKDMIKIEEEFGLFDKNMYKVFMQGLYKSRSLMLKKIHNIKLRGYPIVGVGAAAKGNTYLNFYNLNSTILDYVTDISKHKQGKYTPLTRIPIVGDEIFAEYDTVYALILSWNISDILKENLKDMNDKIEFILR